MIQKNEFSTFLAQRLTKFNLRSVNAVFLFNFLIKLERLSEKLKKNCNSN